jgi:Xaa-Pro aminopeptidase
MHSVGHHLGLDVHDGAGLSSLKHRPLVPGHVITIEPGLYFHPKRFSEQAFLSGFAVRIEDDLVIRATGNELLSDVPTILDCHE